MAVNEQDYAGFALDPKTGQRHAINHLPKSATWEDGVYRLEPKDKILGGIDGIANLPLQQLANRTEYLKQKAEQQAERIEEVAQIAEDAASHGSSSVLTVDIVVPNDGWEASTVGEYLYFADITNETITQEMTPKLIFSVDNLKAAQNAGIGEVCETLEGKLRIYAMEIPTAAIPATLCLFGASGGISPTGLPIATKTRAGIVKVGENIDVTSDGTISVPALSDADGNGIPDVIDGASATDEEVDEMLDEIYGKS